MLQDQKRSFFMDALPFWNKLSDGDRRLLLESAFPQSYRAGESIHSGAADCAGLVLVQSGQVRAFIVSDEGKEITLYHLFERDICLFSASCAMQNISFEIFLEAEKDTEAILIPTSVYAALSKRSVAMSDYSNQLMSSRFSDVMWIMEQVLFKRFDQRLAAFLLEQIDIEQSHTLHITHEMIARHLGSAREVVTRMLKYFQTNGMVELFRGGVTVTDLDGLEKLTQ